MPYTEVTEDQFKTDTCLITHIPTGAEFRYYLHHESPDAQFSNVNFRKADEVLENGDEYARYDVFDVAMTILKRLWKKR